VIPYLRLSHKHGLRQHLPLFWDDICNTIPSIQINSVVCTDDEGSGRRLLASTARASFTINLSDDLTAEQLSDFQV